jgi:Tol biopolymer transport system component
VRLPLTVFIYPVALLAITTIGFSYLRSFVSLADSRTKVRTAVENHSMLAFLHSGTVSSRESITGFRLLSTMSDRSRNNTLATSAFNLFAPPTPQSGDSKIVFASNRDGSMQIYVMNGDGSAITRLTSSGANDDYPRWSPNGTKILFQSDRDHPDTGYMDIYVMNLDGSGVTRLTNDPNDDGMASWSPDGSKIVFQSMRNGVNYQVYSMNADSSNQVNLSNNSSSEGEPSWSPDGTKIAYASDRDHAGYDSVYVMNSDGSNQHAITFSTGTLEDTQPVWSPDGSRIAFVSTRNSTTETWQETDDDGNVITKSRLHLNKEVYVMNADGSGHVRLTNDPANDDSPSWSPGGLAILFRSDRERDCCDPTAQIWSMNVDGTNQANLSNDNNGDYAANWRADISSNDSQMASTAGGSQPPVANAGGPYAAQSGQVVQLNATGSFDPNGTIVSYSWNFGDGTSGTGAIVNHQYSVPGDYSVSVSVADNNGNASSAQGIVTVDSLSLPEKITFDELPNSIVVADQYLNQYGVRFASGNFAFPVHTKQDCGLTCSAVSFPNFISTKPDDTGQLIVTFQQPVSNLVFYAVGVDTISGTFAFVDLYRNGSPTPTNTFAWNGVFSTTVGFTSGTLNNINKVVVRGITDAAGIGFDDFSFTVPADVKITSGRVNGSLNGTAQNALLGGDVALNASPLPGAFAGGTYSWTCTPAPCPIVTPNNSSSVTLRTSELSSVVGNYAVTVTYTKSGLQTSSLLTINSVLPTLASFTGQEIADTITQGPQPGLSNPCGDVFPFWLYRLGCGAHEGMAFDATAHTPSTFISDPSKSGIKYVHAISSYRKKVQGGNLLCNTIRSDPANVASGWQLDDADPYVFKFYPVHYFSEGNDLSMHSQDSPDLKLTLILDNEMADAVYVDDQFEMYVVYFTGNPATPTLQRPLGKLPWNWGGLVVFDEPGQHRIRSTLTIAGPKTGVPTNSMVLMNGRVQDNPWHACAGAPSPTNNLIDGSRVFVRFHYKDFLGRDPDGDPNEPFDFQNTDLPGWKWWTSQITQCAFDLNCIHTRRVNDGLAFFLSGEFVRTDPDLANPPGSPNFNPAVYNHAFVKWCYFKYLHRDPAGDPDGWDFWTNDLNGNGSYSHMIDAFISCADYRGRQDFTTSYEKF